MITSARKPRLQAFVDVKTRNIPTLLTGNDKIDSFASNKGGFVIGSAVFFTGTSGAGKTTFSVFLQKMFSNEVSALYSREMPACDVKEQTERLGINHRNALIADKDDCANIAEFIEAIDEVKPKVVIIDSLQVLLKEDCNGNKPEDELWNLIADLRDWTSRNNAVLFVIGHVTKQGVFEGSNTIKHMFDAHMHMDFDQKKNERTLSWTKNRKGSTTVKRYYEFTADDMVFYTEEEWNSRANSKSLFDVLIDTYKGYIGSMNRNHPSYNLFAEEINKEHSKLKDEEYMEKFTKAFKSAETLIYKHGLVD